MRTVGTNYRSSQPSRIMVVDFRGIDLYNSPTNVALNRSPDAPNMIRDVPGKVRKRMGFFEKADYGARINGVFALVKNGAKITVVHAGTKLLTEAGGCFIPTVTPCASARVPESSWNSIATPRTSAHTTTAHRR